MSIPIQSSRSPISPNAHATGAGDRLLFTVEQAARSLAISKRTLSRLIAGGVFPPPLKIGRSSRVAREDIAAYLEQLRRARGDKLGTS
jgi:excisionase family DNA binding protein